MDNRHKQKVKSIIRRAIKILLTRGWVKNTLAVDKDKKSVRPDSEDAVAFCAIGSLNRARMELHYSKEAALDAKTICRQSLPRTGQENLAYFNDCVARRKEDVIDAFENAIKKLDNEKQ